MVELKTVSIVGSGELNAEFDLDSISQNIDAMDSEYNPEKFHGLSIRFQENGPAVALYRSGSYGVRGASSTEQIWFAQERLLEMLSDLGIEYEHATEFHITNIVFTADLGRTLDLSNLALQLGLESVEYDPEHFPGLVYRMEGGVVLIFSSGKVVLTGFRRRDSAEAAYQTLQEDIGN